MLLSVTSLFSHRTYQSEAQVYQGHLQKQCVVLSNTSKEDFAPDSLPSMLQNATVQQISTVQIHLDQKNVRRKYPSDKTCHVKSTIWEYGIVWQKHHSVRCSQSSLNWAGVSMIQAHVHVSHQHSWSLKRELDLW